MSWSRIWAALAVALCVCACSEKPAGSGVTGTETATSTEPASQETPASSAAASVKAGEIDETAAHLNLQNLVHLADIDHGGLFIDFGTPARNKYTVGQWKTGWGKDGVEGDTTFTYVASNTGRVYLPLNSDAAVTLRFRMQPIGTNTMQPFLNNAPLPSVKLDKGNAFADYDVAVPAGKAHAGENHLLLRFGGTKHIGDEDIAAAVDSIRVLPQPKQSAPGVAAAPSTNYEALPIYGALIQEMTLNGQKRKAIAVRAPTTLSYYVEVPKGGKLSLRVGSPDGVASVAIRVTPEGGHAKELWRGKVSGIWQAQTLSLEPWVGSVIKLELAAQGEGVVGFSSPVVLAADSQPVAAKDPPQGVIVLLIDTMRADHLPPYNKATPVKAPIITQFANEGSVFEEAQAPENWTKPSVASVLTGLTPASHGTKGSESKLSDKALMVSEVFKQAGYDTGAFLANGYVSDKFGFNQGWDFYTNYIRENKSTTAEHVFRDAANWIEQHKSKRFFVYVQTIDPHVPYDPPSEFLKMYDPNPYSGPIRPRMTADLLEKAKRVPPKLTFNDRDRVYLEALYDGEVSYHDKYLGVFIERLKKLGLYDKVMFVITADHGEEFYDHNSYGHGHSVYQELLHVPFMLRMPGTVPVKRFADTVSTIDVSPTVISAAGISIPDVMEGRDRMPQLRGALPNGPAVAFSDFLDDRRVIRAGRWKLILRGLNATFFDLKSDPHEQTELDPLTKPIAMRYCRILLGQYLGTRDRGDWLTALPKGRSVDLKAEATVMDDATKAGLKALGYAN
jgi:choline-sulfatase